MHQERLFERIMGLLNPDAKDHEHFAVYQFVVGLFSRQFANNFPISHLLSSFTCPEVFNPFLDRIAEYGEANISMISNGVDVISELVRKIKEVPDAHIPIHQVVESFSDRVEKFAAILDRKVGFYTGPMGKVPIVGLAKLKIVRLFADLVLVNSPELISEMIQLKIGEKLVALFFEHPENNFLQSNVCDFIHNLCEGEWILNKMIICQSILRSSKLLARITVAQRLTDSLAEMPRGCRPNFMGHVTLLSDQIHGLLEKHGAELYKEIGDLLRTEKWTEYSNKSYRETKVRDASVLGGEAPPILPPPPTEEVFTSIFASSADENVCIPHTSYA